MKRVLVIESGHLMGTVTRADLVKALLERLPANEQRPAVTDAQIRERFLNEVDGQKWAPQVGVDSEVKDGVIELHGVISDERIRTALRVVAENTAGVRGVRDHLLCIEPYSGTIISEGADDRPMRDGARVNMGAVAGATLDTV